MLIILTGMSGSGKDTVQKELIKEYAFQRIVPVTTRPMRENEQNGVDYHFINREEFLKNVNDNNFIEYRSYDTLVGGKPDTWYYGSPKTELNHDEYYCVILDIQGAKSFVKHYGSKNCFVIEIKVSDTVREQRAMTRGSFDKTEWDRRLIDDHRKFSNTETENVVNYTIDNTTNDIDDIVITITEALDAYQQYNKETNKHYVVIDEQYNDCYWEPPEIIHRIYDSETLKAMRLQEDTYLIREDLRAYFENYFNDTQELPVNAFRVGDINVIPTQKSTDDDKLLTAIVSIEYDDGMSAAIQSIDFEIEIYENENILIHTTEIFTITSEAIKIFNEYETKLTQILRSSILDWLKFRKICG